MTNSSTYIKELKILKSDFADAMKMHVPNSDYAVAKELAEKIARLVEGQLEALSKAPITLHDADPIELRESLEKFLVLLPNKDDQARFRGHAAMIDSLISNLQQHNQP